MKSGTTSTEATSSVIRSFGYVKRTCVGETAFSATRSVRTLPSTRLRRTSASSPNAPPPSIASAAQTRNPLPIVVFFMSSNSFCLAFQKSHAMPSVTIAMSRRAQ